MAGSPKTRKPRGKPPAAPETPKGQAWPADRAERRPVESLIPYARNSRTHSPEQIAQIAASIRQWGWTMPVLIDEEGTIIAGHARVMAARKLALDEVPVIVAEGWSEAQRRAYVIADNKLSENAGWDQKILATEFADLTALGFDLALTGFDAAELQDLAEMTLSGLGGDPGDGDPGDDEVTQNLLSVTLAEPREVLKGDVWRLGDDAWLFCSAVMDEWHIWAPYLEGDAVLCPYPGVFVPLADKAAGRRLVMVQPDRYVAGHILDQFAAAKGEHSVVLEHRDPALMEKAS